MRTVDEAWEISAPRRSRGCAEISPCDGDDWLKEPLRCTRTWKLFRHVLKYVSDQITTAVGGLVGIHPCSENSHWFREKFCILTGSSSNSRYTRPITNGYCYRKAEARDGVAVGKIDILLVAQVSAELTKSRPCWAMLTLSTPFDQIVT